ncbi:MAG: hypothetical protein Q7S34_02325 [bacterium]|nr:hypothetical protein [bacterium]
MILARNASAAMPSYVFVGILGVVWFLGSGGVAVFKQQSPLEFAVPILVVALLAGLFFWLENILRFNALPKATLAAYVLLTIEVVGVSVTLIYDMVTLYRADKLSAVSGYHVAGLAFAALAIALFALAPKLEVD